MSEARTVTIPRILVACNASTCGLAAIEVAADLAAKMRGELQGLFVEDVNLLHLAGLPFATEINYSSAALFRLDVADMERTLRAQAEKARSALATTATRASVQWSFKVSRGHVTRVSLEAAAEADLLVMSRESWSLEVSARRPTLQNHPIIAVYDGSDAGDRVLQTAAQLARGYAVEVVVVFTADQQDQVNQLRERCAAVLGPRGVEARYAFPVVSDPLSLADLARRWQPRLLLINRDSKLLDEVKIETLVSHTDCPIGFVR